MFNRTRSIISFLTILATVVFTLTSPITAQKSGRVTSASTTESPSAVLYSNANIQTGTGNGANGSNTSQIATTPAGSTSFGAGMNGTGSPQVQLGERFTLATASTVQSIVFFPYSTATAGAYGNPPTNPFTGATVRIWNGQPGSGGATIVTSSTFGSSVWTGLYRVSSTTLTNSQRPVFALTTTFPNTILQAGNYWATITVTGIAAPGVSTSCFGPPVTNADSSYPTTYANGNPAASVISVDSGVTWTLPTDAGSATRIFIPLIINGLTTTAAGVNVSGRVLGSAEGRGLTGAVVRLTDQNGVSRTTITGRLGSFAFGDVEPGQTYVVSVISRRFSFAPRVVQVVDNVADLEFAPE